MTYGGLATPVRSILAAARNREQADRAPQSVTARPIAGAIERAEASDRVPIIAEVKPTSPTTDGVREGNPVDLARRMVAGGATAISVLTEPAHFGGSIEALERVRSAVDVPVLRKDFIVREDQLDAVESDLVLLIARFVDDLDGLVSAAQSRGFQPLVEVHDRAELRRALATDVSAIGINNRNLASLDVDLGTFERVVGSSGDGRGQDDELGEDEPSRTLDDMTLVAESGISTPADVRRMRAAGADALLVGSAIMNGDIEANTRSLVTAERATGSDDGIDEQSEVDAT